MASTSKTLTAYALLKEAILSGVYPAGERLVIATIAAELNMSSIPVREAIRLLEAERLVRYNHNFGAQVAGIDDQRRSDIAEYEQILESAAATLAASQLTQKRLETLKDVNHRMAEAVQGQHAALFDRLNKRFHRLIGASCPNAYLREKLTEAWSLSPHVGVLPFETFAEYGNDIVERHTTLISLIETEVREEERSAPVPA